MRSSELDDLPLNYDAFRASQQSEYDSNLQGSGRSECELERTLLAAGFLFDSIHCVTDSFNEAYIDAEEALLTWLQAAKALLSGAILNKGDFELTLVASSDHKRQPMSRSQSVEGYRALTTILSGEGKKPTLESAETAGVTYHESLRRSLHNRCFFTTEKGCVGIGPRSMQKSDLVAVLYGSRVPIVLRKCGPTGVYTMVGAAYVHGIMSGEAFDAHRAAGKSDVVFDII